LKHRTVAPCVNRDEKGGVEKRGRNDPADPKKKSQAVEVQEGLSGDWMLSIRCSKEEE